MPQPYNNAVITDAGLALLDKVQTGQASILFTRMAAGDGAYTDDEKTPSELQKRAGLKSEKGSFPLSSVHSVPDGGVKITALITNQDPVTGEALVTEGYSIREIGLFAKEKDTDDSTDVLYSITVARNTDGDYMPPYDGGVPAQIAQEYHAKIENASEVSINRAGAAMLAEDAEKRFQEILKAIPPVDCELSQSSENPVQNKVIADALDEKGSTLFYNKESGEIQLKSKDRILSVTKVEQGSGIVPDCDVSFYQEISNLANPSDLKDDTYFVNYGNSPRRRINATYYGIQIPVKAGKHYSTNGFIERDFSYFDHEYSEMNRTKLDTYESAVGGARSMYVGLCDFVPETDGFLTITSRNIDYGLISVIESRVQPVCFTDYGKAYSVSLGGLPIESAADIYVSPTGLKDFSTIKSALDYVNSHARTKFTVYVEKGTYDIVSEFGNEYFENLGAGGRVGLERV